MDPKELETPFNWIKNTELAVNFDESQELTIDICEEPVLSLMADVMSIYVRTMQKDFERAEEKIQETEDIWKSLDKEELKKENVSIKVLDHVVQATKYYVYKKKGDDLKAQEALKYIIESEKFKDMIDFSTIDGCKSIAWSTFHETECVKAISHAQAAIELNSNCPAWYYLLSKNLRRERRRLHPNTRPSDEEKDSISKCFELSPKIFYKLLYAQILQDRKEFDRSNKVYLEIYESNPVSVNVQLRLALAFIRSKKYNEAKSCLDYAEKHRPENKMFLHYKGIYIKQVDNNLEEAMEYFKKSAELLNFPADITYAKCLMELNRVSECIQHLEDMSEKYQDIVSQRQQLLLNIAMLACKENDLEKASIKFLKAIELDTDSQLLQWFRNELDYRNPINVLEFIKYQLLPRLKESLNDSSEMSIVTEKLEKFCESVAEPVKQSPMYHFDNRRNSFNNRQPNRNRKRNSVFFNNNKTKKPRSDRIDPGFCRKNQFFSSSSDKSRWTRPGYAQQPRNNRAFSAPSNKTEWSPADGYGHSSSAKDENILSPNNEAGKALQSDQSRRSFTLKDRTFSSIPDQAIRSYSPKEFLYPQDSPEDQTFSAPSDQNDCSTKPYHSDSPEDQTFTSANDYVEKIFVDHVCGSSSSRDQIISSSGNEAESYTPNQSPKAENLPTSQSFRSRSSESASLVMPHREFSPPKQRGFPPYGRQLSSARSTEDEDVSCEWKPLNPPRRSNLSDGNNWQSAKNPDNSYSKNSNKYERKNPYYRGNRKDFSDQRKGNQNSSRHNQYSSR